jgi:hypothetical protein
VSVFTGKPHFPSSLQQRLSINCVLVFVSIQTAQAEARNLERAEREREREREKERARSAAMDEWEELAWRVPETLMLVSCEMEATRLIEVAHSNLQVRGTLFRRIHLGMPAAIAMNLFGDPAAEGVIPTEILEEARREISQSGARHGKTRHVFARYVVAHLGVQQDDPAYRSWEVHHQDAIRFTDKALEKVSEAASHAEAAKDAVDIAETLLSQPQPPLQLWAEWTSAAEKLVDQAALEATLALDEVLRARQSVALEFFDAVAILRRGRAPPAAVDKWWQEIERTLPGAFLLVATGGLKALRLIRDAHGKLQERVAMLRVNLRQETPAAAVPVEGNSAYQLDPEGICPTVALEDARREISQSTVLHAKTRHVLARYVAHLGAQQDDPAYRSWDVHHQEAVDHISKALKRVIDTVSNAEAGKVALVIMGSVAYGCPLWDVWASEAEKFTAVAALEATMATNEMRCAQEAVAQELSDAWTILLSRRRN